MQIDNNYQAFLALVKVGLWETELRLTSYGEIKCDFLLTIAQEQSVVGLVSAGLERVVDTKASKEWALQFAGQTLQLEQLNNAILFR